MFQFGSPKRIAETQWLFDRDTLQVLMFPSLPQILEEGHAYCFDFELIDTEAGREKIKTTLRFSGAYHPDHNYDQTLLTLRKLRLEPKTVYWEEVCELCWNDYLYCGGKCKD